jgi:hypothetical protein
VADTISLKNKVSLGSIETDQIRTLSSNLTLGGVSIQKLSDSDYQLMVIGTHHPHHPRVDLRSAMGIACTAGKEVYPATQGDKVMEDIEGGRYSRRWSGE